MATMNVSLPDELKRYVETQVATGLYANVSDFMRTLIRDRKESLDRLDALIQEGLDGGWSGLSFDDAIEQARAEFRSRAS